MKRLNLLTLARSDFYNISRTFLSTFQIPTRFVDESVSSCLRTSMSYDPFEIFKITNPFLNSSITKYFSTTDVVGGDRSR